MGSDFGKFKRLGVEGLRAVDDRTLRIELTGPYPQLVHALAMSFTSPVPLELAEHHSNILNHAAAGTGPFTLRRWVKTSKVELARNPHYREERYPSEGGPGDKERGLLADAGKRIPLLDGIEFHIIREEQTRWLNFRSRKIDMIVVPKDNFSEAVGPGGKVGKDLAAEGVRLKTYPTLTYWWLGFNMKDPLWGGNKHLRLAVAHAIDMDRYIEMFTNNVGKRANSIYPPGIPGYDASASLPHRHDPAKAARHLELAGYPKGRGLPPVDFDTRTTSSTGRQMAEFIASELKKIGIRVRVRTNTFPAFLTKSKNGKLRFWQDGWSLDYPDAENGLQLLASGNHPPGPNTTQYSNPEFDRLLGRLKLLPDGPEKFRIMRRMEAIVHADLPWVMQFYRRRNLLHHARLRNYRPSDLIANSYKYLRVVP